jgi:large subunit GTPase 1
VQIVDARNPLRFRCEDLEAYVGSIDTAAAADEKNRLGWTRNALLLINKADLLNVEQRCVWFFLEGGVL